MTEQQDEERQFAIQRIYTKDLSFESPHSPQIFVTEWDPEISVNLHTEVANLGGDSLEVVLTVSIEAKHAEQSAFLVEVKQAGIFLVKGFSDQEMAPLLGIGAPNALYPYAREVVADLVTRGSFPPFILQPVNFEAMYAQQMGEQAPAETH